MLRKLFALVVCVLVAQTAVRADEPNGDAKKVEGTWLPTKMELAGTPLPDEVMKSIKMVLEKDKYLVTVGAQKDEGTTKVDAKAKPKAMDITGTEGPNKGKTFLAIYELNGDELKICYDLSGKERPKKFETKPNTQLFLAIYQREKK